jgi:hypothetical protein
MVPKRYRQHSHPNPSDNSTKPTVDHASTIPPNDIPMVRYATLVFEFAKTVFLAALIGGGCFCIGDMVAQGIEMTLCRGRQKAASQLGCALGINRLINFSLTGLMHGATVGIWFEILTVLLPPTSDGNIIAATFLDNGVNLVQIFGVQALNASMAWQSIWAVISKDFPPLALMSLIVNIPVDLLLFFFVRPAFLQASLSTMVDGMCTVVLSYYTYRHIPSKAQRDIPWDEDDSGDCRLQDSTL